jgi:hypothetical protein
MFNRRRPYVDVLVAVALGLASWIIPTPAVRADGRDAPDQPIYDVVAVGRAKGEILLATPAQHFENLAWRFRRIPLSPSDGTPRDLVLSSDGSKALVVFSDGTTRVLDLTERIVRLDEKQDLPIQHRLPKQVFPYADNSKVCLLDDLGNLRDPLCAQALAAAVHEDGRVLYGLADGRLVVASPDGDRSEELPYRLPAASQWQLLAGHRGDARDFLVLVTQISSQVRLTELIDPRRPEAPIAQYADPTVAALRAQLEFAGADARENKSRPAANADSFLAGLVTHLNAEAKSDEPIWSFYRVKPDPDLYAPVLEFAPGEPDYPADADVWQDITPLAHGETREAYESAYASLGDRRWSRCNYYVRTISYPGTWLIEYWYYYPFDEGKPHPHFHDSEHMFVEVDKLGGAVRNILASDHDSFVPNNIYSTLVKGAAPVTLPLFAMVELGKHAMAPDLNHDGVFTPGLDDNLHPERYAFWGVRDLGDKKDALFLPYTASVSLPRSRNDRFALASQTALFPALDVPAEHQVCALRPFPDDPPCLHCKIATAETGITHLVDHPDARVPQEIYKPYVLPYQEVRVGVGIFDRGLNQGELYTALVGDMRRMTGDLLRLPVRMALEYMWAPRVFIPVQSGAGLAPKRTSASEMYTGARFERFITNTQGFYFGVTPGWANLPIPVANGATPSTARSWQYDGLWYRIGYILEIPSQHKGNFTNQIGVVLQGSTVRFEWRMSFGILRRRGRHDFGASAGDRNPYQ